MSEPVTGESGYPGGAGTPGNNVIKPGPARGSGFSI